MFKFKMKVQWLNVHYSGRDWEEFRAGVQARFIEEHTYIADDWDDLPSSGEIWDSLYPFLRMMQVEITETYQSYNDYDWIAMNGNVPMVRIRLCEVPYDEEVPCHALTL